MAMLEPELALVRPRVRGNGIEGSRLLEEIVEEYVEEHTTGILWLFGPDGSGKTTALAHLSAVFEGDPRFEFVDDSDEIEGEDECAKFVAKSEKALVVAARHKHVSTGHRLLKLEPWGVDELLEYLMPSHRDQCNSVMQRLSGTIHQPWTPQLARIVLDQLLSDPAIPNAHDALLAYLAEQLPSRAKMAAARKYCLAMKTGGAKAVLAVPKLLRVLPPHVCRVLLHDFIQERLAAEQIAFALLSGRSARVLYERLPTSLIEAVGQTCRNNEALPTRIERILNAGRQSRAHAMAASILLAANPDWRPEGKRSGKDFTGAHFVGAMWSDICLSGLPMKLVDFSNAQLERASFDEAIIVEADFVDANLQKASLVKALAIGAVFDGANLRQANLCQIDLGEASLVNADLSHCDMWRAKLNRADLTNACFHKADLCQANLVGANLNNIDLRGCDLKKVDARGVDFRTADLSGADMEMAWLNHANFEDVVWSEASLRNAGLRGAHLTGSRLPSADLREVDLSGAGLGEIDWENADLRRANLSGATFHMGSSRSGLVNSPIASEGSRTGFYTDELEELYFKSPEEVRKANLRGADLRGAKIDHLDFYLVDLRGAKLTSDQRRQAAQTGAILS